MIGTWIDMLIGRLRMRIIIMMQKCMMSTSTLTTGISILAVFCMIAVSKTIVAIVMFCHNLLFLTTI